LSDRPYLLDLNILIAFTGEEHTHHEKVMQWFKAGGSRNWGICPLTEAGLVRLSVMPKIGELSIAQAMEMLAELAKLPGYRYWPITGKWADLVAPFSERILGHQQVTDAYLLGLAVQQNGILVTFDKAIRFLAGPEYAKNLLLLD
jgi:uncharacterized protein